MSKKSYPSPEAKKRSNLRWYNNRKAKLHYANCTLCRYFSQDSNTREPACKHQLVNPALYIEAMRLVKKLCWKSSFLTPAQKDKFYHDRFGKERLK